MEHAPQRYIPDKWDLETAEDVNDGDELLNYLRQYRMEIVLAVVNY